jgi:hypothetical protein
VPIARVCLNALRVKEATHEKKKNSLSAHIDIVFSCSPGDIHSKYHPRQTTGESVLLSHTSPDTWIDIDIDGNLVQRDREKREIQWIPDVW